MALPQIVSSLLKSTAPTLLTALALPPPFNLIAAGVVSTVLNRYLPGDEKPAQTVANGAPVLTPSQVVQTVEKNANDPSFIRELQEAELRLQRFEMENDFNFAKLAADDRKSSRDFQASSGIATPLMKWGMGIVSLSIASMMAIVIGCLLLISGVVRIPADQAQLAMGIFGIIGTIIGYISGYGKDVIGFYFGSAQGSADKNATIDKVLATQSAQLGQAVATVSATPRVIQAPPALPAPEPATEVSEPIVWQQGPFGGLRWAVTPGGILDEGETVPARTVGAPVTVRNIWKNWGDAIKRTALETGVAAELIVMTIAVESRGNMRAERTEPNGKWSEGLMQVLNTTATDMAGRPIARGEMFTPAVSIDIGAKYIRHQREATKFDPILVAAAYNAGGLYPPRTEDVNPYRLRCTGDHLTRAKLYYNDTVAVAEEDGWFSKNA